MIGARFLVQNMFIDRKKKEKKDEDSIINKFLAMSKV